MTLLETQEKTVKQKSESVSMIAHLSESLLEEIGKTINGNVSFKNRRLRDILFSLSSR